MIFADPPVRDDGLCAQCLGERKNACWNKYAEGQAIADPFCSATCARAWHDAPIDEYSSVGLRRGLPA